MPPSRLRALILAAPLLLACVACADAPTGPGALVVTPETRAALEVASALPRLPQLAAAAEATPATPAVAGALQRSSALWTAADTTGDALRAEALRVSAAQEAAPALAAALDSTALIEAQGKLEHWVELASRAVRGARMPELDAALTDGESLLGRARAMRGAGQMATSWLLTLQASERLIETTPPAVANRLTMADEAALAALRRMGEADDGAVDERRLGRIDRLVRGAREALDQAQYDVAIQRAYYAHQLLAQDGVSNPR